MKVLSGIYNLVYEHIINRTTNSTARQQSNSKMEPKSLCSIIEICSLKREGGVMIKGYEQDGWVGVSITKVESTTIFKVGGVGACNGQTWLLGLNGGSICDRRSELIRSSLFSFH